MSRAVFFAALMFSAPALADARFFSAIDDLPLAPGLSETRGGFAFDGPEGRIIGARAAGAATPDAVRAFYAASLPALGWSLAPEPSADAGSLHFVRGRERLTLAISEAGSGALIEARLVIRPASMSVD